MKTSNFIILAAFFYICSNCVWGQNVNLPVNVQNILNQQFPKWKVVENNCTTVISNDFNNDKTDDYIALITSKKGGSLVGIISDSKGFRLLLIKSLDKRDAEISAVQTVSNESNNNFTLKTCGFNDDFAYIFKNNEFISRSQDLSEKDEDFNDDENGKVFIVKGANPWLNTGINIEESCIVVLRASGKVDVNAGWGVHDAYGTTNFYNADNYPVMSKFRYGLAAQITNSKFFGNFNRDAWAYEGEGTHKAKQSGKLWLVVNDDNPQDNLGEFRVRVFVKCD